LSPVRTELSVENGIFKEHYVYFTIRFCITGIQNFVLFKRMPIALVITTEAVQLGDICIEKGSWLALDNIRNLSRGDYNENPNNTP
jgi:hypothetical protein